MMVEIREGNLFDSGADVLVNTVNCVGVMGKGIALQFKQTFPEVFRVYSKACKVGELGVGKVQVVERNSLSSPHFVINFPTKKHWKANSRYEDIESGLRSLRHEVIQLKVRSIAVPPLGCGLGGLEWSQVLPMIQNALGDLPGVEVMIYAPAGAPTMINVGTEKPNMTPGRAAVLLLMDIYKRLDYRLALIEIQKLAYFLQAAGQQLKLQFTAGTYGPYAKALNHVLQHMEGHFITGTGDGHRGPEVEVGATEEGLRLARLFLRDDPETRERSDRVAALIDGFQTPFGMELLGTVHWVCTEGSARSSAAATIDVAGWNTRKQKLFTGYYVDVAYNQLKSLGWLPEDCS